MASTRNEELHPLQNSLIHELILKQCSVEDLKSCRLVSKFWKHNSLTLWKSRVRLIIDSYRCGRSISEFLDYVQGENCNHLETPLTAKYLITLQDSLRFWTLCGFSVKELELSSVRFATLDDLRNVIFVACPNLEKLKLYFLDIPGNRQWAEEATEWVEPQFGENKKLKSLSVTHSHSFNNRGHLPSWMELLGHFPFIEDLYVNVFGDGQLQDGLFGVVNLIRERDPRKLQFKHIFILLKTGNPLPLVCALQDPGLPLLSLSLRVVGEEQEREFQKVLRIHAGTLKKLTFLDLPEDLGVNSAAFFPPDSKQLESLEEIRFNCKVSSLSYLKFTPNLRKIAIKKPPLSYGKFSGIDEVSLGKCWKLTIGFLKNSFLNHITPEHLDENLKTLKKWIPYVETLIMDFADNRNFALCCELWPNLKSLTILDSQVDDCGITGLDRADVTRINDEGEYGTWRPITVPRPSLADLKELQIFEGRTHKSAFKLGYCSAVL